MLATKKMWGKHDMDGFRTVPHSDTIFRILFGVKMACFWRPGRRNGNQLIPVNHTNRPAGPQKTKNQAISMAGSCGRSVFVPNCVPEGQLVSSGPLGARAAAPRLGRISGVLRRPPRGVPLRG